MTEAGLSRRIASACEGAGMIIGEPEAEQLAAYLALLRRWNRIHNLTGLRGEQALVERGLVDSLRAGLLLPEESQVLDVGSGAGLPAIPLAVVEPRRRWVLVEPRRKRVTFLEEVRRQLSLQARVEVHHARLEQEEGSVPLITSRAVGDIAPLVVRHLLPGGAWVVASTRRWLQDLEREGGLAGLVPEDHVEGPEGGWSRLRRPAAGAGSQAEKGA